MIKLIGIVLISAYFLHFYTLPWAIIIAAGIACVVLG